MLSIAISDPLSAGLSQRRGCLCSFTVTKFPERPHSILLRMLHSFHFDKLGNRCHGMDDPTAYEAGAHIAPRISRWSRAYVERCLMVNIAPSDIIKDHTDAIIRKWRQKNPDEELPHTFHSRDMQLTTKDIRTIREGWARRQNDHSTKDPVQVRNWTLKNPHWVIKYQPRIDKPFVPLTLVWSSPWQVKILATLGHNGAVAMDATFKTNEYGVIYIFYVPICHCILRIFIPSYVYSCII